MTTSTTPSDLARELEPLVERALMGFDVDGVLAPLVDFADDSELQPGVLDALSALSGRARVVIVSGRSLGDLERFSFPAELEVVGSHGLERRGADPIELDDDEQYTFDQLEILGRKTVEAAGDGAWLEYKPASVVVHVREADPELASRAVDAVANLARMIDGAHVKHGNQVCELLARTGSKGEAVAGLRADGQPVVFLGDDVTDESVFESMLDGDLGVRVGDGETAAHRRLGGPADVAELLSLLTA